MLLTMDGLRDLLLLLEPSLHGDFIVYQPFRNNYFDWLTRRLLRWLYLKTDLENEKREEELVSAKRIPLIYTPRSLHHFSTSFANFTF